MSTRRQSKKVNTSVAAREGKRSPLCSHVSDGACGQSHQYAARDSTSVPSRIAGAHCRHLAKSFCARGTVARSAPLRIRSVAEESQLPARRRGHCVQGFRHPTDTFSWISKPAFPRPARGTCWKNTRFCGKQIMLTARPRREYYQTCLWKAGPLTSRLPVPYPQAAARRVDCPRQASNRTKLLQASRHRVKFPSHLRRGRGHCQADKSMWLVSD
jgi:hypothetical protein